MLLDPYPDHLLDATSTSPRPEEAAEQRERVELAFVAAVQFLPARQRAVLLLRDVVGYAADEVAACLDVSVASVNSALQRARATVRQQQQAAVVTREHTASDELAERQLVDRLITAWHAADVDALVATLTRDAVLTMPPVPDRYVGREAIRAFMATVPGDGRLDRYHLVPIRANRQPALAAYYRKQDLGEFAVNAIIVLAVEAGRIASIVRFAGVDLFTRFHLPLTVADRPRPSS
jgi:RNA polymerase sigma-70 factor (ECF subfamily)